MGGADDGDDFGETKTPDDRDSSPSSIAETIIANKQSALTARAARATSKTSETKPQNLSVHTIPDEVAGDSYPPPEQRQMRRDSINIHLHIEEKIGCCLEEFRCQHNNFTGILYVGPLGVVFLGRFLLFEWTVVLKWEDVTRVKRLTPQKDSPIRIETTHNIAKVNESFGSGYGGIEIASNLYDFESFSCGLQKALETLIGLHNDTILDQKQVTPKDSIKPLFRRSNSDPARQMSALFNFDDPPLMPEGDLSEIEYDPSDHSETSLPDDKHSSLETTTTAGTFDSPQEMDQTTNHPSLTEAELSVEWTKKCCQVEETFSQSVVRNMELTIEGGDLDAFVDAFLKDDAPFSWGRYMTDVSGEMDVQATEWVETGGNTSSDTIPNNSIVVVDDVSESGDDVPKDSSVKGELDATSSVKTLTRMIDYTHPVNVPMAPPTARAQKQQILRRYGNSCGLVVETKTFVSDVPKTDCFYVQDVFQIEKGEKGDCLLLNIRFEIVFVKSTIFRSLITRQTTSDFEKFLGNLADYTKNNCRNLVSRSNSIVKELLPPLEENGDLSPPLPLLESNLTDDELSTEWTKMCGHIDSHPENPVCNRQLVLEGGDLNTFLHAFVKDDAGFSWSRYMTEVAGDFDVRATEWVAEARTGEHDDRETVCAVPSLTRTINYTHPVNAPMAPPTARARKEQTLRRFGNDRGLVVETKTIVEGVPKTDCFYVRDILKVHPSKTRKDCLVLNICFEIVFVKSTMFRSLIAKTTTGEFNKFITNLADYLSKNYGNYVIRSDTAVPATGVPKEKSLRPTPTPKPPSPRLTTKQTNDRINTSRREFEVGWRIFVMVFLLWTGLIQNRVWNETSSIRNDVRELQSKIQKFETTREFEAQSLKDDMRVWNATLLDQEATRVSATESLIDDVRDLKDTLLKLHASQATVTQSLRDELRELKTTLSELEFETECSNCEKNEQKDRGSEVWSSRARQAAISGIRRPRYPLPT